MVQQYISPIYLLPYKTRFRFALQVIGIVHNHLPELSFVRLLSILSDFLDQPQWECRHAALLGLKYILPTTSPDKCSRILTAMRPQLLAALADQSDEISAAAMQAILPVASLVISEWSVEALICAVWKQIRAEAGGNLLGALTLLATLMSSKMDAVPNNEQLLCRLSILENSAIKVRMTAA